MAEKTISVDVVDISIPESNHRNIPVINQPNPASGVSINADQCKQLIQIPSLYIYEAGTKKTIDGNNFYDYFPDEGGGGGGGGGGATSYSSLTEKPAIDNHTLGSGNNTSSALGLQTKLTFDSTPTENSTNPITSGGVYTALDGKQGSLTTAQIAAVDSGITSTDVAQITTNKNNILSEQAKTTGMTEGGVDYITVNGIRVYFSTTPPVGARTGDLWIGG